MRLLKYSLILLLSTTLFFGCKRKESNTFTQQARVRIVEAFKVKKKKMQLKFIHSASILPIKEVMVSARVPGWIEDILVDEGSFVEGGQVLLKLDDTDFKLKGKMAEAGLEQAESKLEEVKKGARWQEVKSIKSKLDAAYANLLLMEKEFKRASKLFAQRIISKSDFDKIETQYKASKSNYEALRAQYDMVVEGARREVKRAVYAAYLMAKAKLEEARLYHSYTLVKAPFSGVIVKKMCEVGQFVNPGVPLMQLQNFNTVKIEFTLSREEVPFVKIGDKLIIKYHGKTFEGKVDKIIPSANPITHTFRVISFIDNNKGELKVGDFCEVSVIAEEKITNCCSKSAVLHYFDKKHAFLIKNGVLKKIELETGIEEEEYIEVLNLKEGDLVTIGELTTLRDGENVKVGRVVE